MQEVLLFYFSQKKNYSDTWLLIQKSISGKTLAFSLLPKMLLTYHIVEHSWNSNIWRISRGIKMNFFESYKSTGLGLAWLGIARSIQKYRWEIYLKDRYGQVSFVSWIPINGGSYGNQRRLLVSDKTVISTFS